MANTTNQRPTTVIKTLVAPISSEVKLKVANAVQTIVTKIKDKHL